MKFPIFILDGPDGAGKTTFANAIGGHYIHCTYNDIVKNDMYNYMNYVIKAAMYLSHHSHVVIDRWVMSELVYANVYREGKTSIDDGVRQGFYRRALSNGAVFIHCLPEDKNEYLKSFNLIKENRSEMYMTGMDRVYDEYSKQIKETIEQMNPYFYDRFKYDMLEYVDKIIKPLIIKAWK